MKRTALFTLALLAGAMAPALGAFCAPAEAAAIDVSIHPFPTVVVAPAPQVVYEDQPVVYERPVVVERRVIVERRHHHGYYRPVREYREYREEREERGYHEHHHDNGRWHR